MGSNLGVALSLLYLAIYIVLATSLMPSMLSLATVVSTFALYTVYHLSSYTLKEENYKGNMLHFAAACLSVVVATQTLIFGRLTEALAYAIFGEILLDYFQYPKMSENSFWFLWSFCMLAPELAPVSWIAYEAGNIASPAKDAGFSGFSSVFERVQNAIFPGK